MGARPCPNSPPLGPMVPGFYRCLPDGNTSSRCTFDVLFPFLDKGVFFAWSSSAAFIFCTPAEAASGRSDAGGVSGGDGLPKFLHDKSHCHPQAVMPWCSSLRYVANEPGRWCVADPLKNFFESPARPSVVLSAPRPDQEFFSWPHKQLFWGLIQRLRCRPDWNL